MAFPFGEIGPCGVVFDGTDLGSTHTVTVNYSEQTASHKTAQYGTSSKDEIYVGSECTVDVELTESSLAQLAKVAGNATVTTNELMFASPVGTSLRSIAGKLILKPYVDGAVTSDEKKWITFFISAPKIDSSFVFDAESDRAIKATFICFRATETATGETYAVGDMWAVGYGQTS